MPISISGKGGDAAPSSAYAGGATVNLSTPINIAGKGANIAPAGNGLAQYLPILAVAVVGLILFYVIFKKFGK